MIRTFGLVVLYAILKQIIIYMSEMGNNFGIGFPGYDPDDLEHPSFAVEE